jgi:hypothetical protein
MKVNCAVLQGYTNAGKFLIIDNLIGVCNPEQIPRERDNSGFHLDQLPGSACALFDGTGKLLLEGKIVKTDIKHKDKGGIKRLPIWITTALPITNNIDSNESIQNQQRVKVWHLNKCMEHRTDENTLNTDITRRLIKRAPAFVRPIHFALLWFWHFEEIISGIHDLDKHHVINEEREIPSSMIERGTAWQTLIRDIPDDANHHRVDTRVK